MFKKFDSSLVIGEEISDTLSTLTWDQPIILSSMGNEGQSVEVNRTVNINLCTMLCLSNLLTNIWNRAIFEMLAEINEFSLRDGNSVRTHWIATTITLWYPDKTLDQHFVSRLITTIYNPDDSEIVVEIIMYGLFSKRACSSLQSGLQIHISDISKAV